MPLSFEDIKDLVRAQLCADVGSNSCVYIRQTLPDEVVYEQESMQSAGMAMPMDSAGCKFYRRSYSIDPVTKAVTLGEPVEVRKNETWETVAPASFSLDDGESDAGDGFVIRTGKVFEVGNYPDKDFSLTDAEADEAVANFTPVPNNLEHKPTILANGEVNHLGETVKVWRSGKDLIADVKIPAWLGKLIGKKPLKVSAEWTRGPQKRLDGMALCLNPRINDAAVFAAFTAATDGSSDPRKGPSAMKKTILERLKAIFSGLSDDDLKALETDAGDAPKDPEAGEPTEDDKDAKIAALQAQLAAKDAALNAAKTEGAAADETLLAQAAEKFANDAIAASKAAPTEKDGLVKLFTRLAAVNATGKAMFTDGGLVEGDAIAELREQINARPTLDFKRETLKEGTVGVVFSGDSNVAGADGQPDPARIRALMALTPLGQQILQEKAK